MHCTQSTFSRVSPKTARSPKLHNVTRPCAVFPSLRPRLPDVDAPYTTLVLLNRLLLLCDMRRTMRL